MRLAKEHRGALRGQAAIRAEEVQERVIVLQRVPGRRRHLRRRWSDSLCRE